MQKRTIKLYLAEARHYPIRVGILLFNVIFTVTIGGFAGPFIISRLLDQIQSGTFTSISANLGLIVAYFGTQLYGDAIGWRLNLYLAWTFETSAQRNLYNRIFEHLNNQSTNFHANRFGGSMVSQSNKFVNGFERFWDTIIFQLLPAIASILAATVILSFVFWQYALFLIILAIIFIVVVILGSRYMAKLNVVESQASTRLTGRLADAMTNITAIKSHGKEKFEAKEYDKLVVKWRQSSLTNMRGFLKVSTTYSLLLTILNTTALVAALWASSEHIVPISTVYLCVTYTFTVARQLWEMNSIMRNYNRVVGDAYDMTEILGLESEIKDIPSAKKLHPTGGKIVFSNVTFDHEDKNQSALFKKLNLTIKPGEKIGLVGHSGSGKTTMSKLLLRFMDIQGGTISIDNQDIARVEQSDLRQHISYVPQEPLLFHRSLKENISYGNPKASDKEITAVAKMAHAHDFIENLSESYDTLVGERGVKLSGGQRQRIVIARAMLKNAPILVLDEATSALDSESEALIQDALWKLMEGRTAIIIAHRLSTIQKMDRIIVLDDGEILEQGTHKELIRQKGKYADLWNHQSGGFMEA